MSSKIVGHYSSLWVPDGTSLIPTTVTDQRKSHAKENEAAKRAELLKEMIAAHGEISPIAKSIDGVYRRWNGVKSNASE